MRRALGAILVAASLACGAAAHAEPAPDPAESPQAGWNNVLGEYVQDGRVDYQGIAAWPNRLDAFLGWAEATDPSTLPAREGQLAFWINAYNACAIQGVLERYPVASVKRISGFFDERPCRVAGAARTLNEIEAQGRALGDWRIHMAVVCASSSCPILRREAYAADRLDAQLRDNTERFLRDPSRGLRLDGRTLWVSRIFTWYAADVVPGGRLQPATLVDALTPYLAPGQAGPARAARTLKFLDYDWALNDQGAGNAG